MRKLLITAASVAAALTLALTGCSTDDDGSGADAEGSSTESSTPPDLVAKWTAIDDPKPANLQHSIDACTKLVGPGRGGSHK